MSTPRIVSDEAWRAARLALLTEERAFTKQRDALTAQRMALPWRLVTSDYTFATPQGQRTLAQLFDGASQMIVYHFMLEPGAKAGCKSCSLIADHYNPLAIHLRARDVTLMTVSRAPLPEIETYKARMGWTFPWASSHGSNFNYDFQATSDPDKGATEYNFVDRPTIQASELPGISTFALHEGAVYHTYSSYSRGLEDFMSIYRLLDIVPKGRDEDDDEHGMAWVRHHDLYA